MAEKFFTFSGTEMQPFINFTLHTAAKAGVAETSKNFSLRIGTVNSISGTVSSQKKPRIVLGRENPIGISSGVRIVRGSLTFEVFDQSIFSDIKVLVKEELAKSGNTTTEADYIVFENGAVMPFTSSASMFSMPPFDLIITAVKENNSNIRMKKVIKNIVLSSNASAIGMNTLTVQEAYDFFASAIEPYEDVSKKLVTVIDQTV